MQVAWVLDAQLLQLLAHLAHPRELLGVDHVLLQADPPKRRVVLLHEPGEEDSPLPERRLARDRDRREARPGLRWRQKGDDRLGAHLARVGTEGRDGRAAPDLAVQRQVGEVSEVGSILDRRRDVLFGRRRFVS